MGVCLSKPEGMRKFPLGFPNKLESKIKRGEGNKMTTTQGSCGKCPRVPANQSKDLDLLKQNIDDVSIEVSDNKFEVKNSKGEKLSDCIPGLALDCKVEDQKHLSSSSIKSTKEELKGNEHLKKGSKNRSSSDDLVWELALGFDRSNKISRCFSDKGPSHHWPVNKCSKIHIASKDCENSSDEEELRHVEDFDEISFGCKTAEILDFFGENSCNRPAESTHSHFRLQFHSILDLKKVKSIRLSRFSKSRRINSSIESIRCGEDDENAKAESPSSRFIAVLMKNLGSISKAKWSNIDTKICDLKSDSIDKNERVSSQVSENNKGEHRPCLLSMFNVDRSFNVGGNVETYLVTDDNNRTPTMCNLKVGSYVDVRDAEKTSENGFIVLNFSKAEGRHSSRNFEEATGAALHSEELGQERVVEFQAFQALEGGVCRTPRLSMSCEEVAFGSPFSVGVGRPSKRAEQVENLFSVGRISADAFSDSSSDLFDLEFLSYQ